MGSLLSAQRRTLPKGFGKSYTFVDRAHRTYSFYATTEAVAREYAVNWSRRTGIKLFRRKPKSPESF